MTQPKDHLMKRWWNFGSTEKPNRPRLAASCRYNLEGIEAKFCYYFHDHSSRTFGKDNRQRFYLLNFVSLIATWLKFYSSLIVNGGSRTRSTFIFLNMPHTSSRRSSKVECSFCSSQSSLETLSFSRSDSVSLCCCCSIISDSRWCSFSCFNHKHNNDWWID